MGGTSPDLLVGRGPELARLRCALAAAESGTGHIVVVEGEAGIGKTRLVAELLSEARARGFHVYAGWADELEGSRPLGVLHRTFASPDTTDPLATALLQSLDTTPRTPLSDPILPVEQAVTGALVRACETGPVIVAIEDLHWADEASLTVVAAVARCLPGLAAALVVTRRPSPKPPRLNSTLEALESCGAQRIALDPLAPTDQVVLVRRRLGAEPEADLLQRVSGTGGNPFYLTQMVDALLDTETIEVAEGRARLIDVSLPATLRQTLLRRLRFLDHETLDTLRFASILGARFSADDLSLVMDRTTADVVHALRQAVRTELLDEQEDRFTFRHELIREAVYEDIALPVRVALHRETAQALHGAGRSALEVADHLMRGSSPGDRWVVESLYNAASEAWARSPVTARRIAEHAAGLAAPDDPYGDRLLALLAELMVWTDDLENGLTLALRLLDQPHDTDAFPHLSGVVHRALHVQGRWQDALAWARDVAADPRLPDDDRLAWRALAGQDRLLTGDVAGARQEATAVLAELERSQDPSVAQGCLITLAWAASYARDVREAVDLAERATRLPIQDHHTVHFARGVVLADADRLAEADAAFAEERRRASERRNRSHLVLAHWGSAGIHYLTGAWDRAVASADAGLELIEGTTIGQGTPMSYAVKALVAVHRGELAEARTILAEHDARVTGLQFAADWTAWARGLLLEAQNETEAALEALEHAWRTHDLLRLLSGYRGIGPDLVRIAMQQGATDTAREVTEQIEAIARTADIAGASATALRCRGLVQGDPDILLAAVESYRGCPRVVDSAGACEDAGVALGRAGRNDEAVRMLSEALERYESLGAPRLASRVAAHLRDLGVHPGRRGARGRPKVGWGSLTPTETEVVRLAAEGLSNPDIGLRLHITRRTVATHLSNVYAKLDVSSRAELARDWSIRRARNGSPEDGSDGDDGNGERKLSRASD